MMNKIFVLFLTFGIFNSAQAYEANPTVKIHEQLLNTGTTAKPIFKVRGLKFGHEIRIYNNQSCQGNAVASAFMKGAELEIKSNYLNTGTHSFYAKVFHRDQETNCKNLKLTYTRNLCPSGYVYISANPAVGTTRDFCIMKYEARKVTSTINNIGFTRPASIGTGAAWNYATATEATLACRSLNDDAASSDGYDIISNPEWQTVAREIESIPSNWSNGTVGSGFLNRGFSASTPDDAFTNAIPASDSTNLYNSAANATAATGLFKFKRTHNLQHSDVIWDFSGNLAEWVSWTAPPYKVLFTRSGADACTTTSQEIATKIAACTVVHAVDVMPSNPALTSTTHFIGRMTGGGGEAFRGGAFGWGTATGIYTVTLFGTVDTAADYNGFRCVYRPEVN